MVKTLSILSVFLISLYGCASLDDGPSDPVETDAAIESVIEVEPEVADEEATEPLNTDLLYGLLTAEIAGQRGEFEYALDNYLKAVQWTGDPAVAERAAQIALFLKDYERAEEAVSIWVKGDPANETARKAAFLVYLNRDENEKAIEQIRAWLRMDESDFGEKMEDLAKLLDKGPSTRLTIMDSLADEYSDNADFMLAYSVLSFSSGETELALERVETALDLRPEWDRARLMKARVLMNSGDMESVRRSLEQLIDDKPDDLTVRYMYSQLLVKEREYAAARQQLQEILERDAEHYDAMYALAGLEMQAGNPDAARALYLKLVDQPVWADQAGFYLGRIESGEGNPDAALAWFDKVGDGPYRLDAGLSAVLLLSAEGRTGEATRRFSELRQLYPNEELRFLLVEADILTRRKEYHTALLRLDAGLKTFPQQTDLLYSRALVAEKLGRIDLAESDLRAILEKKPDDVNALNALGYTLVDRTTRYTEAEDLLKKAIRLSPEDPVIIDSYGWLQFKLGNSEIALDYLQRAYDKNPDPEIAAHLGEVLWSLKRYAEAREILRDSLAEHPDSDYLLRMKQRFPEAFRD